MRCVLWVAVVAALVSVVGPSGHASPYDEAASTVVLPPANVDWDYQIGGSFATTPSVGVVSRDRSVAPSAGDYNLCYVNAFQTQRHERAFWKHTWEHWALVLKDPAGRAVVDESWGEWLLDTRTPRKRRSLMAVVGPWIDGCARAGFQGVELDNLDSWNRSGASSPSGTTRPSPGC